MSMLKKDGDYKEKRLGSGMIRIFHKGKSISFPRTINDKYDNVFDVSGDPGVLIKPLSFSEFIAAHKKSL